MGDTMTEMLYLSTAPDCLTSASVCVWLSDSSGKVPELTDKREVIFLFLGFGTCCEFGPQCLLVYKIYLYMGIIRNIFVEKSKFVSKKTVLKDAIQCANSGQTC